MSSKSFYVIVAILLCNPTGASAQLRFLQPTANLGELRGGPVYQHRFDFVNDAKGPLEIADFRLGCGCLQPMLDKRVFGPGEKGTLVMNVRTLGQVNGARTWQTHVQYRLGGKPLEASLTIAAAIRNELTIEPSIVAMTVETTLKQEITITDHRPLPTKVIRVLASSPAMQVRMQALGNGVTRVSIEVNRSSLTAARQEETLDIYTEDPQYRHLQVPITLMTANRHDVSASPSRIEASAPGSYLVRLRSSGQKAVRIEKADADHPAVQCTWAAGPGDDATLKISVDAAQFAAAVVTVRIQLAEPMAPILTIPVTLRKE